MFISNLLIITKTNIIIVVNVAGTPNPSIGSPGGTSKRDEGLPGLRVTERQY